MKTLILRCTSDPSRDVRAADLQFAHDADSWHRRSTSARRRRAAGWPGLLLAILSGGCISSPDASQPEGSENPSAIESPGFNLPAKPKLYYATMASAAASAYPARMAGTTEERDGHRILKVDPDMRSLPSATDETMYTTYFDNTAPNLTRVIIAFRGTVKPDIAHPFSSWTDTGTDVKSQFFTINYMNQLIENDPDANRFGKVGLGWAIRWGAALNAKDDALRKLIERDIVAYTRIKHVEINVVGHSLGGVVAELAGLDIEEYLRHHAANFEVNVVAFNPPRLGAQELVDEYRRRLQARPHQFRISVFTRQGDVVDDLPVSIRIPLLINIAYRQIINNVEFDNLTPFCSTFIYGGKDDPNQVDHPEAKRLPYAPRLHVTQPFTYGAHSIDDWVGTIGHIAHRQVLNEIVPEGFRCLFAPDRGGIYQNDTVPYQPKLNCTPYSTLLYPSECNPNPPPGGKQMDEL
jgi:hypothetical protein